MKANTEKQNIELDNKKEKNLQNFIVLDHPSE